MSETPPIPPSQETEPHERPERAQGFRPRRGLPRPIELDAALDTALFHIGQGFSRSLSGIRRFFDRFRVRGLKRAAVEVLDEVATFGTLGAVLALVLALPAFERISSDWRAQDTFAITILDRYGEEIGRRGVLQNDSVPLSEMPDHLIQATLATEDRRFYSHFGIDVIGTTRALLENVRAQGVVQGGSSITQQLAKNLFLSNERTLMRKITEAFLALWLEVNLTKDDILKLYLDRAYMGGGAFGVVAAAEFYFDKDVRDITLAESAMLAGLYKAPAGYAPHLNLAAARQRASEVLSNMVEAGFLTEGQVLFSRLNPASAVPRDALSAPNHFLDWVFEEVREIAPPGQRVLVVRSTLDTRLQAGAERAVLNNLSESGRAYRVREAAAVLMENDGAVRAMVGGRDYGQSQFNRAVHALRQPGSSFKVFVYATALENGYTPRSIVVDAPITIGGWSPRNYGRSYRGRVTLTTALARSINTIPVRLAEAMGRDLIVETAYDMGIRSELPITRPLPLGVAEVTPLDMASAYASLANGGYRASGYAIMEMRTLDGELVYDRTVDGPAAPRILSAEAVTGMNTMLTQVIQAGTARRAQLPGITAAGKTGTTQAYRDAWFIGYTGRYTASVWYGNDDFTSTANLTGGRLPAMTWQSIMELAHRDSQPPLMPGVDEAVRDDVELVTARDAADEGLDLATDLSDSMELTLQGLANRFDPTNTRELRTSFDIDALGTSDTVIRQADPQVEQAN
ncbi:MAG: PBP1A family penicillin-binding protein [Rhizobiales bacterium]|nr:PBP1A family penicillin-binding protein [Hyphomicrobiales bacterium]MBO6698695.1 PBP1A family penicillin-binding protein [Hyphomicrobiales bacterium]MBO6735052.1 PBP1A family penicillin-binding protein [Hyphomicrobiales bacterium]MBO6911141.1 PBP1A family penicillin-binding protein [Hyphomicrobiales bacterium]MBO6955652.1 PBP1A family penicillin-binding protein [Hyphomicrobiales bacterium]